MTYALDANVLIEAKNRHYGLDFCPAFWDWILQQYAEGKVLSIRQIKDELMAGDDDLSRWVKEHGEMFKDMDEQTIGSLSEVALWCVGQNFESAAIGAFLQDADYYLIAYAKAYGHTVVTHEVPSNSKKRIKIPTACTGVNVPYISPFDMLRREQARFVLDLSTR